MKRLDAGAVAGSSVKLLTSHPAAVAVWLGLYAVFFIGIFALVYAAAGPVFLQLIAAGGSKTTPDPAQMLTMMKQLGAAYALAFPLGLVLQSVLICAIFRAVMRPDEHRFAYVRLGAAEFRMTVMSVVLVLVAFFSLVLTIGLSVAVISATPSGLGKFLAGLVLIPGSLCLLAFVGVRLCLAAPITFARNRLSLLSSWTLTQGQFWPLFGAFVISFIFNFVVSVVGQVIISGVMATSGGAILDLARGGPLNLGALAPLGIFYLVVVLAMTLAQTVVYVAPLAKAYDDLTLDPGPTAEVFA